MDILDKINKQLNIKKEVIEESVYPNDVGEVRNTEVWRKTISVGKGEIIILGAYTNWGEGILSGPFQVSITSSTSEIKGGNTTGAIVFHQSKIKTEEEAIKILKKLEKSVKVK